MKSKFMRRFAKFFVVGASGVAVNMGVLILLTERVGIPYAISSLFAIELSILSNFALNNAWTWSDRRAGSLGGRLLKYHAVAGFTALSANWCLLVLLTQLFGVDYRISNLIGIAAGLGLNFLLNHLWTFSGEQKAAPTLRSRLGWTNATNQLKQWGISQRWGIALVALLLIGLVLRVAAMAGVNLIPEEAYYWMYSQHPSLSYYDHPPMVAWLIGLGTWLFGNTEFGVRIGGAALMLGASGLMYVFGRMWFGRPAALATALLLQALPVYFGAGLLATMDSALVFFWLVGLVGISVALRQGRAWGWYVAGVGLGGAMLSKYTGVFLGVGALLVVVAYQPWRRHLRTVHPYAAALLALALFTPVLVWNAQNDWASFRFQSTDRFGAKPLNLGSIASFVGLQLAVVTPVILGALGWFYLRVMRSRRRLLTPRWLMAVCFSLPLLFVMSYKSLRYDIHLNWTMPLYLSVFPAVLRLALAQWRRVRGKTLAAIRWQRTAFATSVVCVSVNVLAVIFVLALQPRTGWVSAIGPWPEVAAAVEAIEDQIEAETGKEPLIIAEGKYRLASILAFYRTPLEERVRASDFTTSQWIMDGVGLGYPYWSPNDRWENLPCIVVDDNKDIEKFADRFERFDIVAKLHPIGRKTYHIAIGYGRRE